MEKNSTNKFETLDKNQFKSIASRFDSPTADVASDILFDYAEKYQDQECLKRALRVSDLTHKFAGQLVPNEVIDVCLLENITSVSTNNSPEYNEKNKYFAEYYTNPRVSVEQADFVSSMLADIDYIEQEFIVYENNGLLEEPLDKIETDKLWSYESRIYPIEDMANLATNCNIESMMLKSCECLESLLDEDKEISERINSVLRAESFYAPMCEILGLDALAMELRSQAIQLRYRNLGDESGILDTWDFCEKMKELGPEKFIDKILKPDEDGSISDVVGDSILTPEDNIGYKYESVRSGEFALEFNDNDRVLVGNWRLKSVGSLHEKSCKNNYTFDYQEKNAPMDIMGFTLIDENFEKVAEDFAMLTRRVSDSDEINFKSAPSKDKPVIIQGDSDYVQIISSKLDDDILDNYVQIIEKDKGYRVSKFTCLTEDGVPVEMQFMTVDDRKDGRIGTSAHIFHKSKRAYSEDELDKYSNYLGQIHRRKQHVSKSGPERFGKNPHSESRNELAKKIAYFGLVNHYQDIESQD